MYFSCFVSSFFYSTNFLQSCAFCPTLILAVIFEDCPQCLQDLFREWQSFITA